MGWLLYELIFIQWINRYIETCSTVCIRKNPHAAAVEAMSAMTMATRKHKRTFFIIAILELHVKKSFSTMFSNLETAHSKGTTR